MIRPFTCICMLMAAGAGLYLYQTKHRAQLLDREIAHTYRQIEQTKDRIGVLKGEWALLNEPERLAELARQHLTLHTLAPTQFVAIADLANRLPAPLPPGTLNTPTTDEPAPPTIPAVAPTPAATTIVAAKPASAIKAPPAQPVQLATLSQPAAPAPSTTTRQPLRAMPASTVPASTVPASTAPASTVPAVAPVAVPSGALAPPPAPRLMAPIVNVSASPMAGANAKPERALSVPPGTTQTPSRYAATAPSTPSFGSALGGAGHVPLPAPVPYAASTPR